MYRWPAVGSQIFSQIFAQKLCHTTVQRKAVFIEKIAKYLYWVRKELKTITKCLNL
jgi:hypothetical protein